MAWSESILAEKFAIVKKMENKLSDNLDAVMYIREFIKKNIVSVEVTKSDVFIQLADGRRFNWEINDFTSLEKLIREGEIEPQESQIIKQLILKDSNVFDIGANFGWYTTLMSVLVGDNGSVHSFEPNPKTYEKLVANIELNSLTNVRAKNIALSDNVGETEIFFPTILGDAYGSLRENFPGENTSIKTSVNTINSYMKQNKIPQVNLIKIDVEGAELLVLKGATDILESKNNPILVIEIHKLLYKFFDYQFSDLLVYLNKFGYYFFGLESGKLKRIHNDEEFNSRLLFCLSSEHISQYDNNLFK